MLFRSLLSLFALFFAISTFAQSYLTTEVNAYVGGRDYVGAGLGFGFNKSQVLVSGLYGRDFFNNANYDLSGFKLSYDFTFVSVSIVDAVVGASLGYSYYTCNPDDYEKSFVKTSRKTEGWSVGFHTGIIANITQAIYLRACFDITRYDFNNHIGLKSNGDYIRHVWRQSLYAGLGFRF